MTILLNFNEYWCLFSQSIYYVARVRELNQYLVRVNIHAIATSRTHPEHLYFPPYFNGVHVAQSLFFCVLLSLFVLLLLSNALSVILRFTASDFPFDIYNITIIYTLTIFKTSQNNNEPKHINLILRTKLRWRRPLKPCDFQKQWYSGPCAIRHLSFLTSCDIRQKFMVPKYFC